MLTIKILGSGCANCKKLEAVAREAATQANVEAEFIKVTDMKEIMAYDVMSTPALVINEKVVSSGRIPATADVIKLLTAA
ncbi:MAG: glutaredoxin [Burkholderiales bacterium RIFCSPLOWO2_12_FULL_64_99]|jgi:small redox-active disulfide protein 2|uniref:thioredoxin family protein n=1 Tax=Aquabacterium sp. TaxID=1872578 RepID=UPI0008AAEEB0|nr:thioredoxin family protein [Aquabacterium sp.]OGB05442.1 MAG: glutaredoxin [Burkholderiales bacterium RIFCSPHIGHO2_12_FULL_63_20]OGB62445.1 MAG: glutaredoxin [Burkholderiales bacterium RIFCSPLOWO2_12_FULL_64_99]